MKHALRWTLLPMAAVLVCMVLSSAQAQNAAKGGIKGMVKAADGTAAADMPLRLMKGSVELPAGGRGQGGAAPTTQPEPLATVTTDATGAYKFEGLDAGEYTVLAGRAGGGNRGGPGAGAAPGGAAPGAGAPRGGGRGRGRGFGAVKAGETLELNIELLAGRGGQGGGQRGGGAGGAPGAGGAGGARQGN